MKLPLLIQIAEGIYLTYSPNSLWDGGAVTDKQNNPFMLLQYYFNYGNQKHQYKFLDKHGKVMWFIDSVPLGHLFNTGTFSVVVLPRKRRK
jgi:hypothetical protein